MILDYIKFSINSIKSRKIRSWLTMVGIFVGIAAVVALISLGQGLEAAITEQFQSVGTDKLTVQAASAGFAPPGSTAVERLTDKDFNVIKRTKGVKVAAIRFLRVVKIEFNDNVIFQFIISLPEETDERRLVIDAVKLKTTQGKLLKPGDKLKVNLGYNYLDKDTFGKKIKLGDKVKINDKLVEVVGFLEKFGNPQINDAVFMNQEPLKDLLGIGDEIDIIVLQVQNVDNIEQVATNLEKELRKSRNVDEGKEDFVVQTPLQAIETFTNVLTAVQIVIIGIAAISLIVGGIGIMNTMYTAVLERTNEIGVMKSIGAKNSDILTIFLIESGILGLLGGIIGVLLGIGLSKLVELVGAIQFGEGILIAEFSLPLIIGVLIFSIAVGMFSGVFPARQAASLNPVDALRK